MHLPEPSAARRLSALLVALLCVVSACASSSDDTPSASSTKVAADAPARPLHYVALGDSYVSAPLVPVTDVANGCFRSTNNYPTLAARALDAKLVDRSCAGAQTVHLETSQRADIPAQLTALKADTDLVTIGIGGNDGGVFETLTTICPQVRARDPKGAPCEAEMTSGGTDRLLRTLRETGARVTKALARVHELAPKAKVLVVGYPQIATAGDVCSKLPLATGDYAYTATINRALSETLRTAATASGSTYVDVFTASKGHGVCSSDPWVNGSVTDRTRALAYHPLAVEQKAVADLVVAAAKS